MSDAGNPGRIVQFSANMRGDADVALGPKQRTDIPRARMTVEEIEQQADKAVAGGTLGGIFIAKILSMNEDEKLQVLRHAVSDPSVLWFAMLTRSERAEIIRAAMTELRENAR